VIAEDREKNLRERRDLRRRLASALSEYRGARRATAYVATRGLNLTDEARDRVRSSAIDIAELIDRLGGRTHG
jgi:hypothetical protein